jgi:isopenicillin N synthase-like dioxygenase
MDAIPVVSLARHNSGEMSAAEYDALARACEDHGFFLMIDHGADHEFFWHA